MAKKKKNSETIVLNSGHSLIMGHKPESIQLQMINTKLKEHPQEINKFGLFDRATPNYTTYYPDVTNADLNPKDSEFIEPVFRMLSNVTVNAHYNPVYFPAEVLKKSMHKMIGQTINIDHEMATGNAIGAVKSVEWQNATTSNGIKIPAGFNAVLKIDGKSNPRLARGIMMDPPSIHANSVTVNFAWEQSHSNLTPEEFRDKIGSFDNKGKLIQKVATEIKAYHETSLVSHGADPFAQKIGGDGKIVKPTYANDRYPLMDHDMNKASFIWDWKSIPQPVGEEVILNSFQSDNTIHNINEQNNEDMKELLRLLEKMLGLEVESLTEENYEAELGKINYLELKAKVEKIDDDQPVVVLDLTGIEAIKTEITTLRTFKESVPDNFQDNVALAVIGTSTISDLKAETKRLYGLSVEDGKEDKNILTLIDNSEYEGLKALHKQYEDITEGKFGFVCVDCDSHNVTRASIKTDGDDDPGAPKTNQQVIDSFTEVKKVKLPWSE